VAAVLRLASGSSPVPMGQSRRSAADPEVAVAVVWCKPCIPGYAAIGVSRCARSLLARRAQQEQILAEASPNL